LAGRFGTTSFDCVPTANHVTLGAELNFLLEALTVAGCYSVFFVRVSPPQAPLAVVRVIVPLLEGPSSSPSYVPGLRALRFKRR